MADFYVDAESGDNSNDGRSRSEPVRSITRAIELASDPRLRMGGTIHVQPGTYGPETDEMFPLLVPPSFYLRGADRDRTIIRFTGEMRTADGMTLTYLMGEAIHAGRGVSNLTLEADPSPTLSSDSCNFMDGINVINGGTRIEDVTVRAGDAIPPEYHGFATGIYVKGVENATISNVRVERCGLGITTYRVGVPSVEGGEFIDNNVGVTVGSGGTRVQGAHFQRGLTGAHIDTTSTANILNNIFSGQEHGIIIGNPWLSGPIPGPGPTVQLNSINDVYYGIICEGEGEALVEDNTIEDFTVGVLIRRNAAPLLRRNLVLRPSGITVNFHFLKIIEGARPALEENEFRDDGGGGLWTWSRIESVCDLGGGGRSRGGNHFGRMEGLIDFSLPEGGEIFAMHNYWRRLPVPNSQVEEVACPKLSGYCCGRYCCPFWRRQAGANALGGTMPEILFSIPVVAHRMFGTRYVARRASLRLSGRLGLVFESPFSIGQEEIPVSIVDQSHGTRFSIEEIRALFVPDASLEYTEGFTINEIWRQAGIEFRLVTTVDHMIESHLADFMPRDSSIEVGYARRFNRPGALNIYFVRDLERNRGIASLYVPNEKVDNSYGHYRFHGP